MSIREVLKKYPNIETELLLAHALRKPKEFLYMNPEYRLPEREEIRLQQLIKRRKKGEPIAYILGYKDFCGLRFQVNKHVLIPRPETEQLVELVLASIPESALGGYPRSSTKPPTILDLGTGSGCIVVSLAHQLISSSANRLVQLYGSDISKEALAVARNNAKNILNWESHPKKQSKGFPKVRFVQSNLLENIKFSPNVIIANLPYVPAEDFSLVAKDIKFEPKRAIFAKQRGLYEIHRLLRQIASRPRHPKLVFLEFDPRQKAELAKLIRQHFPDAKVKFHKDFHHRWRFAQINL